LGHRIKGKYMPRKPFAKTLENENKRNCENYTVGKSTFLKTQRGNSYVVEFS
jgi:hypothetical protein